MSTADALAENSSDNACGAVGRLILTSPHLVPLEHVLPVLMSGLPLVKDHLEYAPIVRALLLIVQDSLAEVNLSWMLNFLMDTVTEYDASTRGLVVTFCTMVAGGGAAWAAVVESLGPEKGARMNALIQQ